MAVSPPTPLALPDQIGLDNAAQDDDGIRQSQLRERYDGTRTSNEW